MSSHPRPTVTLRAATPPSTPRRPVGATRLALAGAMAATAALGSVSAVAAYPTPAQTATLTSGCTSTVQGSASGCTLHFVLYGANGQPVSGAPVTFTVSGLRGAQVGPGLTVTGTAGPGGADTTFYPGSLKCGRLATVTARSAGHTVAQTQIRVTCSDIGSQFLDQLLQLLQRLFGHVF
jgi:hypothetical protein